MTPDKKKDIFSKISDLYKKAGYFDIYGIDVIISIVIIVLFLIVILYYNIINHLDPIKANWDSNKCRPSILPFAGIINKPHDSTVLDFTQTNFINCTQTMLRNIVDSAFAPIYIITEGINNYFIEIGNILKIFFENITNLKFTNGSILDKIYNYLFSITIPIQKILISFKDLFNKIKGIIITFLYTLLGPYFIFASVLDLFIDFLYTLIGVAIAAAAVLVILAALPFVGFGFMLPLGVVMSLLAALTALMIVLVIVINKIKGATTLSSCFEPNTKIKLENNELIPMKDIKLGSKLKNGSIVNAVMKINNLDENNNIIHKMYKLEKGENNEPIYVTGCHLIYDSTIKEYVEVKNYRGVNPAIESNKKCPELACLITSDQTIPIGDEIFHDWEDNNGSISKSV